MSTGIPTGTGIFHAQSTCGCCCHSQPFYIPPFFAAPADADERRKYAILQAAATLAFSAGMPPTASPGVRVEMGIDLAMQILDELERRQKAEGAQ